MRRQRQQPPFHVLCALTVGAVVVSSACGSGTEPDSRLTLAQRYVGLQVVRDFPDGFQASRQFVYPIELNMVQVAGGGLTFSLAGAAVTGTFDDRTGEFIAESFQGAVTSTESGVVEGMGGRGDDGTPPDGVAQDLTGFVRSQFGARAQESAFVARAAEPPPGVMLDGSGFTAQEEELGRIRVQGPAQSLLAGSGLEVLTYDRQSGAPQVALLIAGPDGSIDDVVGGRSGNILLLSALISGIKSLPVAVVVP